MPAPHRPRHRRSKAAGGPVSASCILSVLSVLLTAACLLGAALCLGGLLAGPFS